MTETEKEQRRYALAISGGGRKPTGIKRVPICVSGQPEQIEKLKKIAKSKGKSVSKYILDTI